MILPQIATRRHILEFCVLLGTMSSVSESTRGALTTNWLTKFAAYATSGGTMIQHLTLVTTSKCLMRYVQSMTSTEACRPLVGR